LDLDPASLSAVSALEGDPFYRSISVDFDQDGYRRRSALRSYFTLSIAEGKEYGRCVRAATPADGVAVWHLPQTHEVAMRASERKRQALSWILGPLGFQNYYRIIDFMRLRAGQLVPHGAWYLSIIAIDPAQQGRGLGSALLAPTLAEADAAGVDSYLETFNSRSLPFYRRLGFIERAEFKEPTTDSDYVLMSRKPSRG